MKPGEEYDMVFRMDYCQYCERWATVGNWKVMEGGVENTLKDYWLCSKCGIKLERKIKYLWKKEWIKNKVKAD